MKMYLERMGRSLFLPLMIYAIVALFMGLGYLLDPTWGENQRFTAFLFKASRLVTDNFGLFFAVGLSWGMSEKQEGVSVLNGLVAFFIPIILVSTKVKELFVNIYGTQGEVAFSAFNNSNIMIGILAGLVAATIYNRFYQGKLSFRGSHLKEIYFLPIVTASGMLIISVGLLLIWPPICSAVIAFGNWMATLGPLGAGLYGLFKCLLLPTSLNQLLNDIFLFGSTGFGDFIKFWTGQGIKGVTGMYQAGFFPVMMFGLPAGAWAIFQSVHSEKKKTIAVFLLTATVASFFTGIAEPLEFFILFVAWPLYIVHAVLMGLSMFIASFFQWMAGFRLGAGLIDFLFSLKMPLANNPFMLLVQGLVTGFIYYFVFRLLIRKFNLVTLDGKEGEKDRSASNKKQYAELANKLYEGLGADQNVLTINHRAADLQIVVNDPAAVNRAVIKATGVPGIRVADNQEVHIIVGTEAPFVAAAMKALQGRAIPLINTSVQTKSRPESETKTLELYAVASGKVLPVSAVQAAFFARTITENGFAFLPTSGEIFTPVAGKISNISSNEGTVRILTETALEILLRISLEGANLKEVPFTFCVKVGQILKHGDKLASIDWQANSTSSKKPTIFINFVNQEFVTSFTLKQAGKIVEANDLIGEVVVKSKEEN